MLEFFDRLRAKPLNERKRIAFGSTISIFAVIMIVWWTTFTSPLTSDTIKATDNIATPINVMGGFFGQIKDGAQALPTQIKAYMQNVATGTGKDGARDGDGISASELLYAGAAASTTIKSTVAASSTPEASTPTPTPPPPTPKPKQITPPPPVAPPTPKQTTPPPPQPRVAPTPPPSPAALIPTRPGKISPSN